MAYILYYCILYYIFIAKLHITLYFFFNILHLYTTGIVKLFKNTFIFDIFCGAWSQKCGATLWHNCLECLFLFLLKKMMSFTDIRQTNQKQCSVNQHAESHVFCWHLTRNLLNRKSYHRSSLYNSIHTYILEMLIDHICYYIFK